MQVKQWSGRVSDVAERLAATQRNAAATGACAIRRLLNDKDSSFTAGNGFEVPAVEISLDKGQVFACEGSANDQVVILREGVLKLCKTLQHGRQLVIAFRYPGDFLSFGQSRAVWHADVTAVTPARLAKLDVQAFDAVRLSVPAVDGRLIDLANDEIVSAHNHMVDLARKSPIEKVASFILELMAQPSLCGAEAGAVSVPMSRHDIADYLGIQTETVSRSFSKLVADQLIALPRPSLIQVLTEAGLMRLAAGDGSKRREAAARQCRDRGSRSAGRCPKEVGRT